LPDPFIIKPDDARNRIGLPLEDEPSEIRMNNYVNKAEQILRRSTKDGSRHPGSFRVLQRYALRATTAAPTVFKPVLMGGEMYCDGGIVASNPSAIAIHEARIVFPSTLTCVL
jgi:patatin-like phospholipase/acyl hydrolase